MVLRLAAYVVLMIAPVSSSHAAGSDLAPRTAASSPWEAIERGDFVRAEELSSLKVSAAKEEFGEISNQHLSALKNLATIHLAMGMLERAQADLELAIRIASELRDSSSLSSLYDRLAMLHSVQGDGRTATEVLSLSIEHQDKRQPYAVGSRLRQLAMALVANQELESARHYLRAAALEYRKVASERGMLEVELDLVDLDLAAGRHSEAGQLAREALAEAQENDCTSFLGAIHERLARSLVPTGDTAAVAARLVDAEEGWRAAVGAEAEEFAAFQDRAADIADAAGIGDGEARRSRARNIREKALGVEQGPPRVIILRESAVQSEARCER